MWVGVLGGRRPAVLASSAEAAREGLAWSRLGRPVLARGYRLVGEAALGAGARRALVARIADGLGGAVGSRAA